MLFLIIVFLYYKLDAEKNEALLRNKDNSTKVPSEIIKTPTLPMPSKCKECTVYGWRPEAREGAKLITIPAHKESDKRIEERTYMFGGLSRDLHSEISYITFDPMYNEYNWVLMNNGDAEKKRYGHTANALDGKIVIIGGAKMYNEDFKRRECLNDVHIYNPIKNIWREIIPNGAYLEPRRYHTSCLFGNYLIVHGGLNDKDYFLGDLFSLNVSGLIESTNELEKSFRWLIIKPENHGLPPTAYHTCSLVLDPDKYRLVRLMTIISMPDIKHAKQRITHEGLYFFGGKNTSGPTNDLYILKIGQKPLIWEKPIIKTKLPPPRYNHSANFFPDRSIMVVFGGRNDGIFEHYGTICMRDIWVFSAETLEWNEWINPELPKRCPEGRYSHCSAVLGKSILIFGGLNDFSYCDVKLYEIDMMGKSSGIKREKYFPVKPNLTNNYETELGEKSARINFKTKGMQKTKKLFIARINKMKNFK